MMRKLVSLLAIMVVACPAVVLGATYEDSFDGTNPDQYWGMADDLGTSEAWGPIGQLANSAKFSAGFGGTATVNSDSGVPGDPGFFLSFLSSFDGSSVDPIPYANAATVSATLNADGTSTACDQTLFAFFNDYGGAAYPDAYLMAISPAWHLTALYAVDNVGAPNQQLIRLVHESEANAPGTPVPGGPLMDMPIECTMQAEVTTAGYVRLSATATGDYDGNGTPELLSELTFLVGVDTPDTNGHEPGGTFGPGDVPVITAGASGFAGLVSYTIPQALNTSVDDFAAWDSLKGDFDLDGDVDVTDLGILATNYNLVTGATVFQGDSNYDGLVNVTDLGDLATNYNTDVWAAGAAVPEPATMTMLVLGALALLIRRRR